MVQQGTLRYWGLVMYAGLIALWSALDKIPLDREAAILLLAPIAAVIAADYYKHKNE